MARATTRVRTTARAAALGALVLALAAGCGAAGDQGDAGAPPADDPGSQQDGGGEDQTEDDAAEGAASDGGGASDSSDDGASEEGGAAESSEGETAGAAEPLPRDADLAIEELPVTAEQAFGIATDEVGGGDLQQIEIDHDDDAWERELELVLDGQQHELDIDATTGEITQHDRDDDDDDRDPTVDVTAPMTPDEAMEIAVGEVPGRVSSWDLDSDDDTVRYQIEVERSDDGDDDDVEVEVEVETGEARVDD